MSIDRRRYAAQPGSARLPLRARLRRATGAVRDRGAQGDGGFTLVEMMVALIIIAIVMTALGSYFVSTVSAASRQGSQQSAVQLTDDALERVSALPGSSLVIGRDKTSTDTLWKVSNQSALPPGVSAYLADMTEAYDSTAAAGAGSTANLPTTGRVATINSVSYTQNWYIGTCWQPVGGGSCIKDYTLGYTPFYRVVVVVTWTDVACSAKSSTNTCDYIASTLVSNVGNEPTFLSNLVAQPPTVVNPGNQYNDSGLAVSLQMSSTGGAGAITWSATGLPTGLSITTSGIISGTPTTAAFYTVTITATDTFNLAGSAIFTWTIAPPPTITNPGTQTNAVGSSVSVTPTLNGGTGSVTWSATGLPAGLSIDPSSGTITGTPTGAGSSSVTLTAKDSLNQTATSTFTWTIYPPLQITTPASQSSGQNATITALTISATGGVTPYSWTASGLPTGLTISSAGVISGKPTTAGTYSVRVTVSDSDGNSAQTSAFSWVINPLNITNPTNALSSTRGTAITPITATATGGSGSGLTWSVVSGSPLPAGITINATTGVISGTPTTAGTYPVVLKVTDSGTNTDTQAFTWTINTTPNITAPTANQASTVGRAISSITATVTGGTGTSTWSATGLPTGITINSTTGVISGTPSTTTGSPFATVITVTDSLGAVDTQSLTWTVNAAPNITAPTANQASTVGKAIVAITGTSTGGTGTKTWSATGLPTGISVSSAGSITGTPTAAGTYSVVFTVTDSVGATDTQALTWTVNAALAITNPTANQSTKKSTAVSLACAATGGTGTKTWSATGLPSGLTINSSTGVISGTTSSTITSYSVVITVTDSLGATATKSLTWSVTS